MLCLRATVEDQRCCTLVLPKECQHSNLACLKCQFLEPKGWVLRVLVVHVSGAPPCQGMGRVQKSLVMFPESKGGGWRQEEKAVRATQYLCLKA